jgi:small subunit ribosomal protein S4
MQRSKEKKERSLGMKLFLKGERCNSPKCVMVRRPTRPGMHGGKRQRAISEYGEQLREKQRMRVSYGLRESQLEKIIKDSLKKTGVVSETIIIELERQLSNVIFRLGLASSRVVARQLISHGHILVNGKKVTIPSYPVKVGDRISIKPSSLNLLLFKNLSVKIKNYNPPEWLTLDKEKLEGKVISLPKNIEIPFDLNLVIDYYSK